MAAHRTESRIRQLPVHCNDGTPVPEPPPVELQRCGNGVEADAPAGTVVRVHPECGVKRSKRGRTTSPTRSLEVVDIERGGARVATEVSALDGDLADRGKAFALPAAAPEGEREEDTERGIVRVLGRCVAQQPNRFGVPKDVAIRRPEPEQRLSSQGIRQAERERFLVAGDRPVFAARAVVRARLVVSLVGQILHLSASSSSSGTSRWMSSKSSRSSSRT